MSTAGQLSYYDLLNIEPDADEQAIKRAFRRIARDDHPDLNGGKASSRYLAAQEAMRVLTDEQLRADYDRSLGRDPGTESQGSASTAGDEAEKSPQTDNPSKPATVHGARATGPLAGLRIPATLPTYDPPLLRNHEGQAPVTKLTRVRQWVRALFIPIMAVGTFIVLATVLPAVSPEEVSGSDLDILTTALAGLVVLAGLGLGLPVIAFFAWWRRVHGLFFTIYAAAVIAAIVFFGSPAVWAGLVLIACALLAAYWGYPSFVRFDKRPIGAENSAVFDIFGTPANGVAEHFGEAGAIGSDGEFRTAKAIQQLLAFPGVKIYHSLRFAPESETDVDHAVVYGNKIALIDSKLWKPGHVAVGDYPDSPVVTLTSGGREESRAVQMNAAVDSYASMFPRAAVRPWVALHSNQETHTWQNSPNNEMRVGDINAVIGEIGAWFAEDEGAQPVNRAMMAKLFALVK